MTRRKTWQGVWKNNLTSDYDYLYEFMKGMLTENTDSEEKLQRLRERGYLTEDGKVNVMIVKGSEKAFFDRIPAIGEELKKGFADRALESAMMKAKNYPSRMQELVIFQETANFISNIAAGNFSGDCKFYQQYRCGNDHGVSVCQGDFQAADREGEGYRQFAYVQ